MDAEVFFYGLADCEEAGESCGEFFNAKNVDLIFAHAGTYVNSSSVLPIHQICKAPVIILNLQPTARIAYDRTPTGEWLAHCGACPVPELSNAFHRSGISCRIINGLLDWTILLTFPSPMRTRQPAGSAQGLEGNQRMGKSSFR